MPPSTRLAWGLIEVKAFPYGHVVAPNGVDFEPLFSLDLTFDCWLWRAAGLYMFMDTKFWGQKANPDVTSNQGMLDFSKREFDIDIGLAWNYFGPLEARGYAYSANNLNRGSSAVMPSGFNDGAGFENRLYLGDEYRFLGTDAFDIARAPFISLGYYPSKDLIDAQGLLFKPGAFARAYLIFDLWSERLYLYGDIDFICSSTWKAKLLQLDAGIAARPFARIPRLEFRVGSEDTYDAEWRQWDTTIYLGGRIIF